VSVAGGGWWCQPGSCGGLLGPILWGWKLVVRMWHRCLLRGPWRSFQVSPPLFACRRSVKYGGSCSDVCCGREQTFRPTRQMRCHSLLARQCLPGSRFATKRGTERRTFSVTQVSAQINSMINGCARESTCRQSGTLGCRNGNGIARVPQLAQRVCGDERRRKRGLSLLRLAKTPM